MKKIFIILLMIFGCEDNTTLPPQQDIEELEEQSPFADVVVQVTEIERKIDLLLEHLEENPINLENEND
tara:strand:- start:28 stop:234 length:207 start_codon:yes stop_codon:yes gene_type:complete